MNNKTKLRYRNPMKWFEMVIFAKYASKIKGFVVFTNVDHFKCRHIAVCSDLV